MTRLLLTLVIFCSSAAGASEKISETILGEYHRLRDFVQTLESEGKIGGLYDYKEYPGYTLMWKINGKSDTIRFYREGKKYGDGFSVDYKMNELIVRDRKVIRRFIGPERTGWRNHTIDLETGYYYGAQGASKPRLTNIDRQILQDWDITMFPR